MALGNGKTLLKGIAIGEKSKNIMFFVEKNGILNSLVVYLVFFFGIWEV